MDNEKIKEENDGVAPRPELYCENCKVKVVSDTGCCPLCHEKLGEKVRVGRLFPPREKTITRNQYELFNKIYFFIAMIASLTVGAINFAVEHKLTYSVIVLGGFIYGYILFRNTVFAKSNIALKLFLQAIICSLFLFAIDYFVGGYDKWSLEYAIPFVLSATTLSMTVLTMVFSSRWRDFTLILVVTAVLGCVPIIFYVTNVINVLWPSLAACLYSLFTFVGIFLFYKRKLTNELLKNFHV